jgi:hypothetical protein
MVTMGPKPLKEAALGPEPSFGRVGDGVQQPPAGAEVVHPSGFLAGVRREVSVSRMVASRWSVSTAFGYGAMEILTPHLPPRSAMLRCDRLPVLRSVPLAWPDAPV